jgi:hypothetical protein
MAQCRVRGEPCSVRATFRRTCIAIVFGRLPDRRIGYEWTGQPTLDGARNAAMSNCRSRGGACELKYNSCDNIDEAAVAAQRRIAEQTAAQEAQRQRIAAEAAAARAAEAEAAAKRRQTDAEAAAKRRQADVETNAKSYTAALPGQSALWNPASQIGSGVIFLAVLLLIKSFIEKRSEGQSIPTRILIGTVSSTIAGIILFVVGVKSEYFLLLVPIGGGFAFAMIYDAMHA